VAPQPPRLNYHDYVRSPITRTLFLLKKEVGMHLQSELDKFPLLPTSLERQWMDAPYHRSLTTHTTWRYLAYGPP
jgi:hypothetical protein